MKRALAAALLALSVSACGAGTARGDVAARIGDVAISVDRVAELVEAGLRDREHAARTGDDRLSYQRAVLERLVSNELIELVAQRLGVSASQTEFERHRDSLDQGSLAENRVPFVALLADNGISAGEADAWIRTDLLRGKVQDKLVPEPLTNAELRRFDNVQADHIQVTDARRANDIVAQLRAGADFATLARRFSVDERTRETGGRMPRVGRGQLEPEMDKPLFEGPINAIQGPIRTRFGFEILRVTERQIVRESDVPLFAKRQVQAQVRNARLEAEVDKVVADVGLEINPRFGTWDGLELGGIPDDLSSPAATARPAPVPTGGGFGDDPNQPQPTEPPTG